MRIRSTRNLTYVSTGPKPQQPRPKAEKNLKIKGENSHISRLVCNLRLNVENLQHTINPMKFDVINLIVLLINYKEND